MSEKKVVHVISHSHWDREWYMPFEKHRLKLIVLMDTLLELFENDPDFSSFHLDGQTIVLDDYLQIRPERRDKLTQLVQEGKLNIGPWYILQDEFLTSSEANIRNLLIGLSEAEKFGQVSRIGYFPDSFGNIGQAPQILRQAGMDCAVFGRGVKATGFNNNAEEGNSDFESPYSEMIWAAPDGSEVLGILFANWYHNGMEIPANEQEAIDYWTSRIAKAERFASTPHLLFMNGCDHQPVQKNLSEALYKAKELFPDVTFVHSNFNDYIRAVQGHLPAELAVIRGELRSQRTNGWTTLVNTASSRVYIKQANQLGQAMLEKVAEPLAAFAAITGKVYPHHLFNYAWKTLIQNHPHDSICGCSVDDVHREMMTRFEKSRQVAEELIDESLKTLTDHIDTSVFTSLLEKPIPFTVFNTTGWTRTGVVSIELNVERHRTDGQSVAEIFSGLEQMSLDGGELLDHEGNVVPSEMEDLGVHFSYDLPEQAFRRRFMARRIRITFEAVHIPALGFKTFAWGKPIGDNRIQSVGSLFVGERSMENDHLKVMIENNGSITLTDKLTGHTFRDLGVYEDVGDIGNEYVFFQPEGDQRLTTQELETKVILVENCPARAIFEIIHEWELPERADDKHDEDIRRMTPVRSRRGQRVQTFVPIVIKTRITLERSSRGVKMEATFCNKAKDHRLRVLLPTDISANSHSADSIFEVAVRSNIPAKEWTNPSNCQHQQAFVDIGTDGRGITVANRGLNEYEIVQDGRNTIAITLLRSVAELGDWGVFPTGEAQCMGEQRAEWVIFPHSGDGKASGTYALAYQYQVPWAIWQTDVHAGLLPAEHAFLQWSGESLALSGIKVSESRDDLILRWFNMGGSHDALQVTPMIQLLQGYESNVIEERIRALQKNEKGHLELKVSPYQILTLAFELT